MASATMHHALELPGREQHRPDAELAALLAVSRSLPPVRGTIRLAEVLRRFYLRRRRQPVEARVHGATMVLDPHEYLDGALLFYPQLFDHREVRFLRRTLRPGDVFADLGAHVGFYSLVASKLVGPSGMVLAVEADPSTCERLRQHLAANDAQNVRAIHAGVSDRAEVLELGINTAGNRSASSFLRRGGDAVAVPCQPLLDILQAQGVARLHGVKLDVEGFEHRVLGRFLEEAPPPLWPAFVIVERWNSLVESAGGDVVALLQAHGYDVRVRVGANHVMVRRT